MKYASLTEAQKRSLIEEVTRRASTHEPVACREMALWCKEAFGLMKTPGKSTVARVLKDAKEVSTTRATVGISKKFRTRSGASPRLEHALFTWVCNQYSLRRMISGPMIIEKARRLQEQRNAELPDEPKLTLNFSAGWLVNFKRRWNLRSFKTHGEGGDADMNAVEQALPDLMSKIRQFDPQNVFNADECGLFYKLAPDRTVSLQRPLGRKKSKDRITVLVCANSDGTEKYELMFIGTALRPRPFKKKSGQDYGLDYHANRNAWMTSALFYDWLKRFDAHFNSTARKILLLLDNCSAHGSVETAPDLQNVELYFLPPNTTSKIQPCDAGIIATLKMRYRNYQMDRALDMAEDENIANIYKVDVLSAMQAFNRIWIQMDAQTIANCWRHTGILGTSTCISVCEAEIRDEEAQLRHAVQQLVPSNVRIDINDLLNPVGENNCIADVSDDQLVDQITGSSSVGDEPVSDGEGDDVAPLPPIRAQLQAIALCKRLCEAHNVNETIRGAVSALQREVRRQQQCTVRQTTLDGWLK